MISLVIELEVLEIHQLVRQLWLLESDRMMIEM